MADGDRGAAFLDREAQLRPRLVSPLELRPQVEKLWREGLPPGDKTGWPTMDRYYTVPPGMLTVITGWPGSGKSEWLDALLVHLAHQGWRIAIFSPENRPLALHQSKHLEKVSGKPFGHGPTERISFEELGEYLDEMSQWFRFIDVPDGAGLSPRRVIDAATPWLEQQGEKRGLVIDPWNELEHLRPPQFSETEYVSQTLSMIRNWGRSTGTHIWIVAHPQKMRREEGKLPIAKLDMVSGSQHWWNKADFGISVWRDMENHDSQQVDIHVLKVRFKHTGRPGVMSLRYDRVTGRYTEYSTLYDVKRPIQNRDDR